MGQLYLPLRLLELQLLVELLQVPQLLHSDLQYLQQQYLPSLFIVYPMAFLRFHHPHQFRHLTMIHHFEFQQYLHLLLQVLSIAKMMSWLWSFHQLARYFSLPFLLEHLQRYQAINYQHQNLYLLSLSILKSSLLVQFLISFLV